MCTTEKANQPGFLPSVLASKCPRCRKGDMFVTKSSWKKGFLTMRDTCPACGQPMEIETGFYYGTGYVSYALTVAISVASFVAWYVLIGISLDDNRIYWWVGVNAVLLLSLQRWLMRFSRTLWLSFFVRYNKDWKNEKPDKRERYDDKMSNAW